MLARNSVLEDTLPSISTDIIVLPRSMSRALTSFCSSARFHAFSSPRILPPSSLSADCRAALRPTLKRITLTVRIAHFMELMPCSPSGDCPCGDALSIGQAGSRLRNSSRQHTEFANGQLAAGPLHSRLAAKGEELADRAKGLVDRGVGVGARAGV